MRTFKLSSDETFTFESVSILLTFIAQCDKNLN